MRLAISKAAHLDKLGEPIDAELKKAFHKVSTYVCIDIDNPAWPRGANHCFIRVCKDVIQGDPNKPFLWLEPDAIPLKSGWLSQLESEYLQAGKPFMGMFVDLPGTKHHMSGVGIYRNVDLLAPSYVLSHEFAFDIVMADQVLPRAHFTSLIHHDWRPVDPVKNFNPDALVYHQDKTGVIIDYLRGGGCPVEKPSGGAVVGSVLHGIPASPSSLPEPAPEPESIPKEIRRLCKRLGEISRENNSRLANVRTELKLNGLIPRHKK